MVRKIISEPKNYDPPQKWSAFQKTAGWEDTLHSPVKLVGSVEDYIHDESGYTSDREEIKQLVQKMQSSENSYIDLFPEATHKETEPDPHKMFHPSRVLRDLVDRHLDRPNEEEARAYNKIRAFYAEPAINRFEIIGLENIISQEIEDYLTGWASRIATDEDNYISKGGRFTPDVCMGLIDRLQLDPHNPRPVLDRLYIELFNFASQIPRQRGWGQITVKDSELFLEVNKEAFTIPNLEDFD